MAIAARIALYSSPISVASHRVRFILAEKGINVDVINVEAGITNEDLIDLNPDQTTPTHDAGRPGVAGTFATRHVPIAAGLVFFIA